MALGGWKGEDSYLRSVLIAHLSEAASALGDEDLCQELLSDIESLTSGCGVNGAVVAFAGPLAHSAGILSAALGDLETALTLRGESVAIAQRLGAKVWIDLGSEAMATLGKPGESDKASLVRSGNVWTVSWRNEEGSLAHAKGLADITVLVARRNQSVSALQLAGGTVAASGSRDEMVDVKALDAYRTRLRELSAEMDQADAGADIGRSELLQAERDQLLAEIRRVTGLGGRIRTTANDPAERARKAVSARIRDAIRRLSEVAPGLAAHLDRSIQTGLECSYSPTGSDSSVRWFTRG